MIAPMSYRLPAALAIGVWRGSCKKQKQQKHKNPEIERLGVFYLQNQGDKKTVDFIFELMQNGLVVE